MFKSRKTISSRAEFDGAHTKTRTRYLRLELTTSGFYIIIMSEDESQWISTGISDLALRERIPEPTRSLPLVGKKPSSPSLGISSSRGLQPTNHGDAFSQ